MKPQRTAESLLSCDFRSGAMLLVDKPPGWTSFDVVNKIRRTITGEVRQPKLKVGHAGTLDPMATGLLIVCTGKWTKRISSIQDLDKAYIATLRLGGVTASYDAETPVEEPRPFAHLTGTEISEVFDTFKGTITQIPPAYSAIKQQGKPLYKLARKGIAVTPGPRQVQIHLLEIAEIRLPEVVFRVRCSKGTYIRSLAHDIGGALGCGAYLTALRRTAIGPYRVEEAWAMEPLVSALSKIPRPVKTNSGEKGVM